MHRHRPTTAPTRGEQLELFAGDTPAAAAAVAAAPSTATADGAPVSTARARVTAGVPAATSSLTSWSVHGAGDRAAAESNDMALVSAVLAAADRDGYFLADPDDDCWRTGTETDSATGTVALVESDPAEAAMVAQLVARGWLHRGARPRRRAGTRRGRPRASDGSSSTSIR